MTRNLKGIAAGIVAAAKSTVSTPGGRYAMNGHPITCPLCKHDAFDSRRMLLNTRGLSFFNLDWLNDDAVALICRKCSRVELFAHAPQSR